MTVDQIDISDRVPLPAVSPTGARVSAFGLPLEDLTEQELRAVVVYLGESLDWTPPSWLRVEWSK